MSGNEESPVVKQKSSEPSESEAGDTTKTSSFPQISQLLNGSTTSTSRSPTGTATISTRSGSNSPSGDKAETISLASSELSSEEHSIMFSSDLSISDEYQSFRSTVPLKQIVLNSNSAKAWKIFEHGPKSVNTPLLCLTPVCGTADIFYRQILGLTFRGIRVISVEAPVYWSVNDWCDGFKQLLDQLDIDKVHIFGASLGGFLAQKFAESTKYSRCASLILCNTFVDTAIFNYNESSKVFWMLPSIILKKMILGNFSTSESKDRSIIESIDFMTERLDTLQQQELASRLTINCVNAKVEVKKLSHIPITLIDVFDDSALDISVKDNLHASYPHARQALISSGGNFPYLSRSDEINMHIMIHLRGFIGTKYSAIESISDKPLDALDVVMSNHFSLGLGMNTPSKKNSTSALPSI